THIRDGAGSAAAGTLHARAARTDRREVIPNAATAAHGFGRLSQRGVDAGLAAFRFGDGVAHGLHEAVDERALEVGSCSTVDAACRNEAVLHRPEKFLGVLLTLFGFLDLGQRVRDSGADL